MPIIVRIIDKLPSDKVDIQVEVSQSSLSFRISKKKPHINPKAGWIYTNQLEREHVNFDSCDSSVVGYDKWYIERFFCKTLTSSWK